MPSSLTGFQPLGRHYNNPLLKDTKELFNGLPSTEDLQALQNELKTLRERVAERINKAERDEEQFQAKWDAVREKRAKPQETLTKARENLKARGKDSSVQPPRIKREASEAPSADEFIAPERPRIVTNSSRKSEDIMRKKKRKRDEKRESNDLDVEMLDGIARSSPPPAPVVIERPAKKPKHAINLTHSQIAQLTIPPPPPAPPGDPDVATDFSLPPNASALSVVRPTLGLWGKGGLLKPTPLRAYDVVEDYINAKAPVPQGPINQFWKEAESWMKNVGEEDVAWLRYSTDDSELFNLPPIGRHYSEVWEEEDQALQAQHNMIFQSDPSLHPNQGFASSSLSGQLPGVSDPSQIAGPSSATSVLTGPSAIGTKSTSSDTLTDKDLVMEKKSLGPFTERVLSALLPVRDPILKPRSAISDDASPSKVPQNADRAASSALVASTTPGVPTPTSATPQGTDATTGEAGLAASTISPAPVHFLDLETRLRMELKACGLLGPEEPNFAESNDDDIASTLRTLQRQLRSIKATNDARKDTLSAIAQDRLAYYYYLDLLEDLNKQISTGYAKIIRTNQKANAAILGRRKNKPGGLMGSDASAAEKEKDKEALADSLRLKTLVLDVPESLTKLIDLRRQFKEAIGRAMLDWEKREPGRLMGHPTSSIFSHIKPSPYELDEGVWEPDIPTPAMPPAAPAPPSS